MPARRMCTRGEVEFDLVRVGMWGGRGVRNSNNPGAVLTVAGRPTSAFERGILGIYLDTKQNSSPS
jgi:hypothetical protein